MKLINTIAFGVISISLLACDNNYSTNEATATEPPAEPPATVQQESSNPETLTADSATTPQPTLPTISPTLPTKETAEPPFTLESLQHDFDVFSWESFIALNWPANSDGTANTSLTIGQNPGSQTVWQHYKESRDIFLPDGATPPAWGVANPPPSVCPQAGDTMLVSQVGKTPNVLDESGEPFQTGPLIDQNGQYARFAILTNEVMFNYIRNNNLYSKTGQAAFPQDANFPISTDTQEGSIMIKAAWKIMGADDDASKFHTSEAYVYDNPHEYAQVEEACTLQTVGLVGLHIGTKAEGSPQWVWSTFEQVDNVPTQDEPATKPHYNFYNPTCTDCVVNTPPPRPWNPGTPHTQPSQIERVIAIDAPTKALNASYQAALNQAIPNSVWANYELVSTQWPTNATSPTDPTGVPAPSFLANTTLESYIQGSIRQTSSSCIQCHNNATMTNGLFSDFTYLLQRAQ